LKLKTAQERTSFEFFATHAITSLRGFLDSPFWQREILQAAHQNESIQHCIVALGAMHRRFYDGNNSHINQADISDEHLQFALRQSNQAIQGLVKASGPDGRIAVADKVTLMTCSVLFNSMACLQGHQKEGLQHLRSGIRMLNEMDSEESDRSQRHPINIESLRSLFVGLDMQARSIMTSEEARKWEPIPITKEQIDLQDIDVDGTSLIAMQMHIQALINHVLAFLQVAVKQFESEQEILESEYRQLLIRFDRTTILLERLCAKAASSTVDITQPLASLQLLHCQLEWFLKSPRSDLEEHFFFMRRLSEPLDLAVHFTRMLDLATRLLPNSELHPPVFTTTMGPLAALWMVVTRAPSSCIDIRRRAVELMLSHPRREGFWDGLMAGKMAQEVLRIEQQSTQEELGFSVMSNRDLIVPDDLRIVVVELSYDEKDERKAKVAYRSGRDMALNIPGNVQHLTW
jgi:hypothetical protein